MRRFGLHSLAIKAVFTVVLAPTVAHAAPAPVQGPAPPQPTVALGTTAFMDADGGPGTLVQIMTSGSTADRVYDASGDRVPVDFRQRAEGAIFHVAYISKIKVLGGYLGGEVLQPIAHVNLRAPGLRESTTGIGDTTVGMVLQYPRLTLLGRPLSVRLDLDVAAPTGSYERADNVNVGNKLWQVSPYVAWTWRVSERWELSNRINYNWSSVGHRPPLATQLKSWQPGDQLAVNLSASYAVAENWRVGIGGYTLQQLSDSKADGVRLANTRQSVFAAGPSIRWGRGKTALIASAYKEFGAENRSEGYQGVVRIMRVY